MKGTLKGLRNLGSLFIKMGVVSMLGNIDEFICLSKKAIFSSFRFFWIWAGEFSSGLIWLGQGLAKGGSNMCFLSLEQGIGVGGVAKVGVCKNKYTH